MANVSRINGFKPVQSLSGGPYCAKAQTFYHAAGTTVTHDLFVGDPVVLSGSGDADGIPSVVKATLASDSPCIGVIVGFKIDADNKDKSTWIDGARAGYLMVDTSLDTIYEVQVDEAIAVTEIGKNAIPIQTAAGDRDAGTSGIELDGSMANGTADMFKLWGMVRKADNEVNATYNKALVVMNNPQRLVDRAGV